MKLNQASSRVTLRYTQITPFFSQQRPEFLIIFFEKEKEKERREGEEERRREERFIERHPFLFYGSNYQYCLHIKYTGMTDLFAETILLRQLEALESDMFWCRQVSLIRVFQIPVIYLYYSTLLAVFRSEKFVGGPHFSQLSIFIHVMQHKLFCKEQV